MSLDTYLSGNAQDSRFFNARPLGPSAGLLLPDEVEATEEPVNRGPEKPDRGAHLRDITGVTRHRWMVRLRVDDRARHFSPLYKFRDAEERA